MHHPCMPEYGSEPRTLHIYACICICKACKKCLSMELDVMKVIEVDLIVVWIFYSFNSVFVSSYTVTHKTESMFSTFGLFIE